MSDVCKCGHAGIFHHQKGCEVETTPTKYPHRRTYCSCPAFRPTTARTGTICQRCGYEDCRCTPTQPTMTDDRAVRLSDENVEADVEAAWQTWAENPEWTYGNRKAAFIAGYGYALEHLRGEFMSAEIGRLDRATKENNR